MLVNPTIENINTLELSVLVDMLAEQTEKYTNMMSDGCDQKDYDRCKLTIEAIQKEIADRQQSFNNNTTTTLPDPPGYTL